MPKSHSRYVCQECGRVAAAFMGRCPQCGSFNSMIEEVIQDEPAAAYHASPGRGLSGRSAPRAIGQIGGDAEDRIPVPIGEFSRVLGGGIVPGSIVLVGGDPGIGKSTLMLQLAESLAGADRRVLYVSGEESEEQVRLRAGRLGPVPESLLVLTETDLESVLEAAAQVRPDVMVVDSIQTLSRADLEGGPGTVTQVRECALALLHFAKGSQSAVFLVGHVTKEGAVAGPRVLEHMVDAVLYLEGERYQHYRVLRAAKNRFGSTNELGVYEMTEAGLAEVANPSQAFLSHPAGTGASRQPEPGTAVVASIEGTRPLLVEVQALVATSFYGTPQRVTSGFDPRRLALLLAVLERRVGLRLGRHDVFVTVTGGLTLDEPGTDLGVALAVASSYRSRPVLDGTLAVGEVSLSGELRRVSRVDARVREAAALGFKRAAVPAVQAADARVEGIEVVPVATLREAIGALLGAKVEVRPPDAPPRPRPGAGSA